MGSGGVGKSAIVLRFMSGAFLDMYDPTSAYWTGLGVRERGRGFGDGAGGWWGREGECARTETSSSRELAEMEIEMEDKGGPGHVVAAAAVAERREVALAQNLPTPPC